MHASWNLVSQVIVLLTLKGRNKLIPKTSAMIVKIHSSTNYESITNNTLSSNLHINNKYNSKLDH